MNAGQLLTWISTQSRYMSELNTTYLSESEFDNLTERFEYFQVVYGGQPIGKIEDGLYVYLYFMNEDIRHGEDIIAGNKPTFFIPLEDDVICFYLIDEI